MRHLDNEQDNDDEQDNAEPGWAAERRDQAGQRRDGAASQRDRDGQQRDAAAELRDQDAADREHDGPAHPQSSSAPSAAGDRRQAGQDRAIGAGDRLHAARDRDDAATDRRAAAQDRHHASLDGLTGVYTRDAGLLELERDIGRARREGHRLTLAFVDVDHLKIVNDASGHAAGDQLLRRVADALTTVLRPYDLVIRHGGDEFLCSIPGIDAAAAHTRLNRINTILAAAGEPGSVTVGIAHLQASDTGHDLIDRADTDMYQQRRHRTPPPAAGVSPSRPTSR